MFDYHFDSIFSPDCSEKIKKNHSLNECFNKFLKRHLLLSLIDETQLQKIEEICPVSELKEELRVCNELIELIKHRRIYSKVKKDQLDPDYTIGHLSVDALEKMDAFKRIKIAIEVLNILDELEKKSIFPGAVNLNAVIYDTGFCHDQIYLGSVIKYQMGCLQQLFPITGYDSCAELPLFFNSSMQHTADARLALSILTPCDDSLKGLKHDDPLVRFLGLHDDLSPDELRRAILSHLDVSWLRDGLSDNERQQLRNMYPDIIPVTSEVAESYKTMQTGKETLVQSVPEPEAEVSVPEPEADTPTPVIDPVPETLGIVPGKIGMCFIVPPFTQTEETHTFREQISLVQHSAAVALGSRIKDLETAYFWANSPEDVHALYGKSSHTGFMPYDISYSPPIIPGKSKDASYIREAYVSSESLAANNGFKRVLQVVLLPGADTYDANWVAKRAKKENSDRTRVLLIHTGDPWETGINTDDSQSLQTLPDEIREAFSDDT